MLSIRKSVAAAAVCLYAAVLCSCVLKAGDAAIQRGSALFQQKKFDEARAYFEAALNEETTFSTDSIYILISNCYSQQADYDNALVWRQKALELSPQDESNYLNMAFIYRLKKDDAKAEALFKAAADIAPDDPAPYASLAAIYISSGRLEEALFMLEKANALNEKIPIVHADMAVVYARMGQFDLAQEELEIAEELKADNIEQFRKEVEELQEAADAAR